MLGTKPCKLFDAFVDSCFYVKNPQKEFIFGGPQGKIILGGVYVKILKETLSSKVNAHDKI